ncbi:PilZ domain-containing protein [Ralstonia sp. 21MJYT02-11]|uniref:PilZ domain-containing protein n=1 Tax=Ralstonia soli TaxID=2953896 RepID=A0ABT1AKE2_9RALS|nr:PilZ domain-containing protein [Ralstonia soli]MCO5398761.1 PilZ domain-containing protein [Ralstonia soli]
MGTPTGTPTRPGIVSLAIKDEAGLHAAYMPFLKNGGIFVPTQRPYRIGEEVFLVLSLLDRPQKYQVAGKVAWITPVGTPAKTPGIGVHFGEDEPCRVLRRVIEELLGKQINSQRPTQTL